MKSLKFFKYISLIIIVIIVIIHTADAVNDLTVVGKIKFADGLFRLPIGLIDCLSKDIKINFISTEGAAPDFKDVPGSVVRVVKSFDKTAGNVSILFDAPWHTAAEPYKYMPQSKIKLAYTMLEASEIPPQWVQIFNAHFDAIVVPDEFLVSIYKYAGVKKPIFVVPCGLYLDDFLKVPTKNIIGKPFKFGISAGFGPGKNQLLLLEAFAQEFGNDSSVELHMHGRVGSILELENRIKELKLTNVKVIHKSFSHADYVSFMSSLDCYILLSKGEGFSITPREALAMGIPCILSDHTAHTTLCKTGLVKCVKAEIKVPIYYSTLDCHCGYQLSCTKEDAQQAMREIYTNYGMHAQMANKARKWAETYRHSSVKKKYMNLIKPTVVKYGAQNIITDDYLMTNSQELFAKYVRLQTKKG
jgi:glycosyltransferase involved in cell wall biosynthesis